jgi:hypothetical protein
VREESEAVLMKKRLVDIKPAIDENAKAQPPTGVEA